MRERSVAPLSSSTLDEAALLGRRHQSLGLLQRHHVDAVLEDVLLQRGGELRALGVLHGDEVLDGHGVEHLAAEALRSNAGADALARGVDRGRGTGRAAADDQHVEGLLLGDRRGLLRHRAGVELGDDLLQAHAPGVRTARR